MLWDLHYCKSTFFPIIYIRLSTFCNCNNRHCITVTFNTPDIFLRARVNDSWHQTSTTLHRALTPQWRNGPKIVQFIKEIEYRGVFIVLCWNSTSATSSLTRVRGGWTTRAIVDKRTRDRYQSERWTSPEKKFYESINCCKVYEGRLEDVRVEDIEEDVPVR